MSVQQNTRRHLIIGLLGALIGVGLAIVPPATASPPEPSRLTTVAGLTVEHRHGSPIGVDATHPRFGWQMRSDLAGQQQGAYQILVSTTRGGLTPDGADQWNSGRVGSASSVAVRYEGAPLEPSTRYWWTVRVWDGSGRATGWSGPASFETGLMSTDGTTGWDGARWISMEGKAPGSEGMPVLRTQASLDSASIESARLYISALGSYDAYVNGRRVGAEDGGRSGIELLTPGWTNYDRTVNYMSYDVTELVDSGRDVTLGAVLGNGWYNGRVSRGSTYWRGGPFPVALKAKLLVRFDDGTTQSVVTDPGGDWAATDTGPYRTSDIYDGQTTDGRRNLGGWSENGYDVSEWSGVVEDNFTQRFPESELVAYPGETARIVPELERDPQSITVYDDVVGEETSPNGLGRIVVDESRSTDDPDEAATRSVTIESADTAIYDMGQNMVDRKSVV